MKRCLPSLKPNNFHRCTRRYTITLTTPITSLLSHQSTTLKQVTELILFSAGSSQFTAFDSRVQRVQNRVYLNFIINWWRLSSLLPPYTADIPHAHKHTHTQKTHFISPPPTLFFLTTQFLYYSNVSLIPAVTHVYYKAFAMLHNSQSKSM
jgi:hypothetical protein